VIQTPTLPNPGLTLPLPDTRSVDLKIAHRLITIATHNSAITPARIRVVRHSWSVFGLRRGVFTGL
jgi:hypothetical protein